MSVDTKQKQTWNFALLNLQNFFDRRKKNLTLLFFSSNSIEGSSELKNHRKFDKTAKIDRKYLFFVLDSLRRLRDFINLFFRWSSENQNKNVNIDYSEKFKIFWLKIELENWRFEQETLVNKVIIMLLRLLQRIPRILSLDSNQISRIQPFHLSVTNRDLNEFCEDPKNLNEKSIRVGRQWLTDELRSVHIFTEVLSIKFMHEIYSSDLSVRFIHQIFW